VAWPTFDGKPPKLLGHGGEKFYLPEHTTGSYELAAITGKKLSIGIDWTWNCTTGC
jgi:glycerophosphoryl diester phosphodiesterase